jgi:hypothetical protein
MERLLAVETRLAQAIDILASRIERQASRIERQVLSLRDEINTRFDALNAKVEVLNEDTLYVRASQREILKRISELETKSKAS